MAGIFGGLNLAGKKPAEHLATDMSSRLEHEEDWFWAKWKTLEVRKEHNQKLRELDNDNSTG